MTIEDYIFNLENPKQAELIEGAHNLIESLVPQIKSSIKWKVPYYEYVKHMCYLNPQKNGGIEICFVHGKLFSNEQGLLQDKNRKYVRGLQINSLEELYQDAVAEIIVEAVTINEELERSGEGSGWYSQVHRKKKK
jgi:hypothetical protein